MSDKEVKMGGDVLENFSEESKVHQEAILLI